MLTIERPKNRNEWLTLRRYGIGSSEVGTILGVNPYDTPYQLWLRKTGRTQPTDETFAMKAGHILEDAVAQFFADETGRTIIKSSAGDWLIYDSDTPHLRVSPDRTYWLSSLRSGPRAQKGILECKTTQRTIDALDLPRPWYCQLQYQLGVAGFEQGAIAWLTAGREFGYRDIFLHREFFDWMVSRVTEFWERNIVADQEPEPISVADVMAKYSSHTDGKIMEATDEVAEACEKITELKEQIAALEEAKAEAEKVVKMAFADAEALTYGGATIATWRASKASERLDTARLKAEHPEIAAQYIKESRPSRQLRIMR